MLRALAVLPLLLGSPSPSPQPTVLANRHPPRPFQRGPAMPARQLLLPPLAAAAAVLLLAGCSAAVDAFGRLDLVVVQKYGTTAGRTEAKILAG